MKFLRSPLGRILGFLASLKFTVVGLAWLAVLTVWGTLHQAGHGLFQSRVRFYDSWYFTVAGFLPLPGGQTVLTLLFLNLLSALLLLALLRALRPGIVLIHAGLVLLLAAGAATFYGGRDFSVTLLEGQGTNLASSYQEWELAVLDSEGPGRFDVHAVDTAGLREGEVIAFPDLGLTVRVETYLENSLPGSANQRDPNLPRSASGLATLTARPREKDPGSDRPGLIALVESKAGIERFLLHAHDGGPTLLRLDDREFGFSLRRKRFVLPGTVTLADFRKELYPNSSTARSFSSRVSVEHGGVSREVTISMNKPLRFGGHTFYQSSYKELPDGREASVFSVVRNVARVVPYAATGVTFLGLAVYFLGLLALRLQRRPAPVPGGAVSAGVSP